MEKYVDDCIDDIVDGHDGIVVSGFFSDEYAKECYPGYDPDGNGEIDVVKYWYDASDNTIFTNDLIFHMEDEIGLFFEVFVTIFKHLFGESLERYVRLGMRENIADKELFEKRFIENYNKLKAADAYKETYNGKLAKPFVNHYLKFWFD